MAALMGLSAEQKYSKSYAAIAKAVRLFCPPEQVRGSLQQLFAMVALSSIVGNGDAHLKNFGLLCTPIRLGVMPVWRRLTTSSTPPRIFPRTFCRWTCRVTSHSLLLGRGLLDFARVCEVQQPQAVIVELLETLERVLARFPELCERAPHVVAAIRQSASPFMQTFA